MRALSAVLAVLSILLAVAAVRAQPPSPPPASSRDARVVGGALAVVDTIWSERAGRRSARVVASLGARPAIELHAGATVRTAIAAHDDLLLVVAFHGGDRPFARALLAGADGAELRARPAIELPLLARRGAIRPSAAVAAPTPDGFTILLQETDSQGAAADVRTTMYRLSREGALLESREVAVPWALAAIAWNGRGYHLAVLWGGWGTAHAGSARICLVTLSPEGVPQQHPWWASPMEPIGEVMLLARDESMQLVWRRGDGRTIALHDASRAGGWSAEPPPPTEIARVDPDAPFAPIVRDGAIAIVTP